MVFFGKFLGAEVKISYHVLMCGLLLSIFSPKFSMFFSIMFLLVFLHEMGHVIFAKWVGLSPESVCINMFGGAAKIPMLNVCAKKEFFTALGGPFVNLILMPIFFISSYFHEFWNLVSICNLILLSNLLPIMPLDGGRLLRSSASYISGDYRNATIFASIVGRISCVLISILSIYLETYITLIFMFFLYIFNCFILEAEDHIREMENKKQA